MSKKPTAQTTKQLREELMVVKEDFFSVQQRLWTAESCTRELEKEQASRDVHHFRRALLLVALFAVLLWLPRLPNWRSTLASAASCLSPEPVIQLPVEQTWSQWASKFVSQSSGSGVSTPEHSAPLETWQALLCPQLELADGKIEVLAGVLGALVMVAIWRTWNCDALLFILSFALYLCILLDVDRKFALATTTAIQITTYIYYLAFGPTTDHCLHTRSAHEFGTIENTDEVTKLSLEIGCD